jgi:hypothetical protein
MTARRTSLTHAGRLAVALGALGGLLGLLVLGLTGVTDVSPSHPDSVRSKTVPETVESLAVVTAAASTPRSLATLPTITARERAGPTEAPPRAGYAAPSRPAAEVRRPISSLPSVMPTGARESSRTGCDPAYPEERTCIPPGPPLDAPCAITDERNFTVLPPDSRRLDADGDGIGCEPMVP